MVTFSLSDLFCYWVSLTNRLVLTLKKAHLLCLFHMKCLHSPGVHHSDIYWKKTMCSGGIQLKQPTFAEIPIETNASDEVHAACVVNLVGEQLKDLLAQQHETSKGIEAAKKTLVGLARMYGEQLIPDEFRQLLHLKGGLANRGLTAACREVLAEADEPLSARNIFDRIQRKDSRLLQNHRQPVATVTTILHRLARYGEVEPVKKGKRRYWASTLTTYILSTPALDGTNRSDRGGDAGDFSCPLAESAQFQGFSRR
jgi:hypothetical protein